MENLDVQKLSAIAVNAGELTAGKIKSQNNDMLIDIDAGKIVSKLMDNGVVDSTMELNTASLAFSGKDSGGNPANMTFSMQGLTYINRNTGGRSKLVLSDGDRIKFLKLHENRAHKDCFCCNLYNYYASTVSEKGTIRKYSGDKHS